MLARRAPSCSPTRHFVEAFLLFNSALPGLSKRSAHGAREGLCRDETDDSEETEIRVKTAVNRTDLSLQEESKSQRNSADKRLEPAALEPESP